MKFCLRWLLMVVCLDGLYAQPSTYHGIYELTSPQSNSSKCNTPSPSFLCDPDEVLLVQDRQKLHDRLLDFERATRNPNASDYCKAKGIRLSVLLTQNDLSVAMMQPSRTVGQVLYDQWALDRECGKTAVIAFCNRTKKSSLGLGTQNSPIFTEEFVHVIGMEEIILKRGEILPAFMEITDNLQKIAVSRAILLGLRVNNSAKEEGKFNLGLYNLTIVFLIALLNASMIFGVFGWAYHRYWMSKLKKRDHKNMLTSWKNPPNGTQPVQSRFVSDDRAMGTGVKTPIPVVPF